MTLDIIFLRMLGYGEKLLKILRRSHRRSAPRFCSCVAKLRLQNALRFFAQDDSFILCLAKDVSSSRGFDSPALRAISTSFQSAQNDTLFCKKQLSFLKSSSSGFYLTSVFCRCIIISDNDFWERRELYEARMV